MRGIECAYLRRRWRLTVHSPSSQFQNQFCIVDSTVTHYLRFGAENLKSRLSATFLLQLQVKHSSTHRSLRTSPCTETPKLRITRIVRLSAGQFISSMMSSISRHDWLLTYAHPPDVVPLLFTNDPPSLLQSTQLNASIERFSSVLPELQGEINMLRRAVASLERQMSRLLSLKRKCETVLSPFRRLPPEILMEILRCTWTIRKDYCNTRHNIHEFGFNVFVIERGPWRLGHVCSSWRYAIENLCPDLWSTMTIEMPLGKMAYRVPVMKRNMVPLLERVLKRTRGHPLDFFFNTSRLRTPEADRVMDQCFDLMLVHSRRWRRAVLVVTPPLLSRISLIHGKVDRLEEVYFRCIGDPNHFLGHDVTPKYLHVISSSPNLLSFSWHHYSRIRKSSPPYYPLVTHLKLQKLSACSGKLLRSLKLPALTEMDLRSCDEIRFEDVHVKCPPDALSELKDLLIRSQCSLTVLSLVDARINKHLFAIIALCPHLSNLSIVFNEWKGEADPFMASLVRRMSETQVHLLVPYLKRLQIELNPAKYEHISFIDRHFVEMINSRVGNQSGHSSSLERFTLGICGRGWDWDLDEAGLKELSALDGNHGFRMTMELTDVNDLGDIESSESD
ncbi:uncharacterized protein EV420DRAFT_1548689 [Desarmillaria tabescens]|uniref:F-box domain-containing protein n=1 Tax=Armillaria tabescens TaxID=1929756 RepID=A0AA39KCX5_ARMTA|nr:uncharacterized protein EV420DRAFT_1548689 [Desarmillaria tabescens]KAK0457509.1 hypothetical protein EV420DRAFT_1548689 [Desarmillaria tabescens]